VVKTDGSFSLTPVAATVNILIDSLSLKAINNHLKEDAKVDIVSGHMSMQATAILSLQDETLEPNLRFTGKMNIGDMSIAVEKTAEELVSWRDVTISGIDYTHLPASLKIEQIALIGPSASMHINEEGISNLAAIDPRFDPVAALEKTEEPEAEPEVVVDELPAAEESEAMPLAPFPIEITEVLIQGGSLNFKDKSIAPTVAFSLHDANGTISGLRSEETARAKVDLNSRLNNSSPMTVVGEINPLSAHRYIDLKIDFSNLELPSFGSYFGKYAGYDLEKGQLSIDVAYHIEGNDLEGENNIKVDQFTLGEKTNSPEATKLPVRLAISLLKDRKGLIELDVPVSGNLDDPSFSYGSIIAKAIVNVITKLVTSPFSMLASLGGGGGDGEDFKFILFEPGTTSLSAAAMGKLDNLASALYDRPNLQLEILGGADSEVDKVAIQQQKLDTLLEAEGVTEILASEVSADGEVMKTSEGNMLKRGYVRFKSWITPSMEEAIVTTTESPAPVEEAERVLSLEDMTVTKEELQELAVARADVVKSYLLSTEKIDAGRLFLMSVHSEGEALGGGAAQVDFELK
jgi:hypothetical protein